MKKYFRPFFLGICLWVVTGYVQGQQPKIHEKCIYLNTQTKKLYVQEKLDVYFFMSTSPDGKGAVKLQSESARANPMHFDGSGLHFMQHNDVFEPEVVKFEIYADGQTPKTEISYGGAPLYQAKTDLFVGQGIEVNLKFSDLLSGVKETYFSADGAEFALYNAPIKFSTEKSYTFRFYSADNVGNAEEVKIHSIIVDFTSPMTSHTINGEQFQDVLSPRTSISLTAQDALSGVNKIMYKIDDASEKQYFGNIALAGLPEGNHTLTYYSVDHVKNKEAEKTYSFFLDKSAPVVVDEVLGNNFMINGRSFSSGRTKFKLTAVDNKSGVKEIYYSLDNVKYELYDKPFYLPSQTGSRTIKFYSVDNVGNKGGTSSESSKSSLTYVDLTGPSLSYGYQGPSFMTRDTIFINQTTKIQLKALDPEAGLNKITYMVDKSSEVEYKEPFVVQAEGKHTIEYLGYDNVENTNKAEFSFIVDNTAPEVFLKYSTMPNGKKSVDGKSYDLYPPHVVLFFAATDIQVGSEKIYFSLNNTPERLYTGPISGFNKGTIYTLKARILDKLGNQLIQTYEFAIEDKK